MENKKEFKTVDTDITFDKYNYIRFSQSITSESKTLKEISFMFDGDLHLISAEQIIPFFKMIDRVKEEMAKL